MKDLRTWSETAVWAADEMNDFGEGLNQTDGLFAIAKAINRLADVVHEMAYGTSLDMGALARISVMMEKSADVMAGGMMEVANAIDRHGDE